jgi:hypothetical protein
MVNTEPVPGPNSIIKHSLASLQWHLVIPAPGPLRERREVRVLGMSWCSRPVLHALGDVRIFISTLWLCTTSSPRRDWTGSDCLAIENPLYRHCAFHQGPFGSRSEATVGAGRQPAPDRLSCAVQTRRRERRALQPEVSSELLMYIELCLL